MDHNNAMSQEKGLRLKSEAFPIFPIQFIPTSGRTARDYTRMAPEGAYA